MRSANKWYIHIFLKSVTYWPTLSKFRGGPVKKITLYMTHLQTRQVTDPSISPPPPLPPAAPSSSGRSGEEPLRRCLDLVLYWIISLSLATGAPETFWAPQVLLQERLRIQQDLSCFNWLWLGLFQQCAEFNTFNSTTSTYFNRFRFQCDCFSIFHTAPLNYFFSGLSADRMNATLAST